MANKNKLPLISRVNGYLAGFGNAHAPQEGWGETVQPFVMVMEEFDPCQNPIPPGTFTDYFGIPLILPGGSVFDDKDCGSSDVVGVEIFGNIYQASRYASTDEDRPEDFVYTPQGALVATNVKLFDITVTKIVGGPDDGLTTGAVRLKRQISANVRFGNQYIDHGAFNEETFKYKGGILWDTGAVVHRAVMTSCSRSLGSSHASGTFSLGLTKASDPASFPVNDVLINPVNSITFNTSAGTASGGVENEYNGSHLIANKGSLTVNQLYKQWPGITGGYDATYLTDENASGTFSVF